jgi:hypothetical protein
MMPFLGARRHARRRCTASAPVGCAAGSIALIVASGVGATWHGARVARGSTRTVPLRAPKPDRSSCQ